MNIKKLAVIGFLFVVGMIFTTLFVQAQEAEGGIAGTYAYEGEENGEAYTGSQTVSGIGPVYMLSFEETNDAGETVTATAPTIAQGNVIALPLPNGENCGTGTLLRQANGNLFSLWLDKSLGMTALGIEYWAPQAETTGFAGTYDVVGTYADGALFQATADITEGENGVYTIVYHVTVDDKSSDPVPYDWPAIGMVKSNVMGYSSGEGCGVFVAEFSDSGTYDAVYIDAEGNLGTENGSK